MAPIICLVAKAALVEDLFFKYPTTIDHTCSALPLLLLLLLTLLPEEDSPVLLICLISCGWVGVEWQWN